MTKDCWVSPEGLITWCQQNNIHEKIARQIVKNNKWYQEFKQWNIEKRKQGYVYTNSDFLIDEKGYIKYMDWQFSDKWFKCNINKTTNKQAWIILFFSEIHKQQKQTILIQNN
ncbi:MAG: hypothetical protein LBP63_10010 [Prevotellaceae bacterium]|jgi:hypothetical protein|nr:hypothetical protein [Prevotellaceae bacterium]